MKPVAVFLVLAATLRAAAPAAEQEWEIRGEFVALEAGNPEMVVLRVGDRGTVRVPLDALSAAGQAAVRRQAAARPSQDGADDDGEGQASGAVTARGPFGKSVRLSVPESIKDLEADAIHCRTAAVAADVYRLGLAGDRLEAGRRAAAATRLREWAAMADEGLVRLGDRWVVPGVAEAAAAESARIVSHALELMRNGSGDLAEEELRKAARMDPESARVHLVLGLTYALVARNPAKAVEYMTDAVRRDPGNAVALNDLAVLEVLVRRPSTVASRFREAIEAAADPAAACDNVAWAVRLAAAARTTPALAKNRLPDKTVEDLNALYRTVTQDLRIKPAENLTQPRFLGPDGTTCAAATLPEMARQLEAAGPAATLRRSLGFVIAPGRVVCPRDVLRAPDGAALEKIAIEVPTDRQRRITATVVAAPEDGEVALLMCDELDLAPLPLAAKLPAAPQLLAVDRAGDSWLDMKLQESRGTVVSPRIDGDSRGRFLHSAVVPRGPGGGPIVDEKGEVIGMVGATPRTDASGNTGGFGIPVERIRAGIATFLPDVDGDAADPQPAAGAISRTVVVAVTCKRPAAGAEPAGPGR